RPHRHPPPSPPPPPSDLASDRPPKLRRGGSSSHPRPSPRLAAHPEWARGADGPDRPRRVRQRSRISYGGSQPRAARAGGGADGRSEEHTSELQSLAYLVC